MALYFVGLLIGPVVGLVMGHFTTMSQAWVISCVVAGICGVAAFF